MASWTGNPIMEWSKDGGTTWNKISDHGRSPLSVSYDRIETSQRMANGTLRRYVVAKKRKFSTSWQNIPDRASTLLTNGQPGSWMETFHNEVNGAFLMRLRSGSDRDTTFASSGGTIYTVMITDFSKEITKRGIKFDLWNVDISLDEV